MLLMSQVMLIQTLFLDNINTDIFSESHGDVYTLPEMGGDFHVEPYIASVCKNGNSQVYYRNKRSLPRLLLFAASLDGL